MKRLVLILCITVFASVSLARAVRAGEDAFTWHLLAEPAAPGETVVIEARLSIEADHIVYADMTGVSLVETTIGTVGEVEPPKGKLKQDPFGDEPREIFTGEVVYRIPVTIAADLRPGRYSIELTTKHQGCSQTMCFFPARDTHTLELVVGAGSGGPAAPAGIAEGGGAAPAASGFGATVERGWMFAFVAVFVGGILTSFTPCVYPLIPITVSIFGAAGAQSRMRAFGLSTMYVLGMAAMYSGLGVAAAASGAVFGQVLSSPLFVGIVAGVFVLFGLSMIGLFEIQLPSKWQTALSGAGKAGPAGAFGMGLVAGIVAAPCTGPVLGAVLAYVATTRNLVLGFLLLFTYALGMGMLFLALGTFASLAGRLPRSGPWMDTVKSFFGIVMFAMALYFLKEVVPPLQRLLGRGANTWLWAGVLVVGGGVLGAFRGSIHGASLTAVLRKAAAVTACAIGAYMAFGSMLLPAVPAAATELVWRSDLDTALADAQRDSKPVMIDFYADWCVQCKELEAHTFTDPAVAARLSQFVLVHVDLTADSPENTAIQERFGIVGLPHVTFIGPDGGRRDDLTLKGFEPPAAFLGRVQRVTDAGSLAARAAS